MVVSSVTFRDPTTWECVDPGTVQFFYQPGTSPASYTITWTDATTPAVGTIARLGVGRYKTWIDTSDFLGQTLEQWDATGAYQAIGASYFLVVAP